MTPSEFCRGLLASLDAAEGRRRRRRRDTTPDAVGIAMERALLERAVAEDPAADSFDGWLAERVREAGTASGPLHATALRIFEHWRLASSDRGFSAWLANRAPSDDAEEHASA